MTHMNLKIKLALHYKTAVYSHSVQCFFTAKPSVLKRFSVYKTEINLLVHFKISRSEKRLLETISPLSIIQEINLLEGRTSLSSNEMQYWSTPKT